MKKYDIIVAGGGYAGVAAAIAAKRQGAENVLLLEETNALGGATSRALVNPYMPYWTPIHPKEGEEKKMLSRGIFEEITDRLRNMTRELHGAGFKYCNKPSNVYSEEYLKVLLNRMMAEEGVEVLFHTSVAAAKKTEGKVTSVTLANCDGLTEAVADYYIDCTGDADLTAMAGFECRVGREADGLCQPMTLCFRVGEVDKAAFNADKQSMQAKYKELQAKGEIKNIRENILVFETIANDVLHFNTTRVIKYDPTYAADITKAEMEAREQVWEMFLFLRKYVKGCENAQLLSTAMQIGVRESRMICGEYTLTQEDLLQCRKFDDGIAACNYEIDIHNPEGSGTSHYFFPPHEYYTIPYRCLIPRGSDNLLVAGRCISSDHEAQASYRIMPTVCTLGEAAGVAAAMALKEGRSVRAIPAEMLRDTLEKQGAVVR